MTIACVVEGQGETSAVPALIRRIAAELALPVQVGEVIRTPKTQLLRSGELEKRVDLAARKSGPGTVVLVLFDADADPPLELTESITRRLQTATAHIPCGVAVAVKEFESWFIAGVEGLRGRRGFSQHAESIPDPESRPGAKEWLSRFMPPDHPYAPTVHQAPFTSIFDMAKARERSSSFDRCYQVVERLIRLS